MQSLLATLAQLDIKIESRDGKLRVSAPAGVLTDELKQAIAEHRDALLERLGAKQPVSVRDELPSIVPDEKSLHEPFPLTEVQHAYWIGRSSHLQLGGVATHLYCEFTCPALDVRRLSEALRKVVAHHEMLRAVVDPDGRQRVLDSVPEYNIIEHDLRLSSDAAREEVLGAIRAELSQQVLPADRWPLFDIRVGHVAASESRLFVSLDLLIVDALSLLIVIGQWHEWYFNQQFAPPRPRLSFRDYVLAQEALRDRPAYAAAKKLWWDRIDSLPPAPLLPVAAKPAAGKIAEFRRHRVRVPAERWAAIKARGRRAGLTSSSVLLAAFAEVLTRWSKNPHYSLSLTLFNRLPMHEDVVSLVGDFTNLLVLEVDHRQPGSFTERALRLQARFLDDFEHRSVSAVEVLREWVKRKKLQNKAVLPVVFTSTLMLDGRHGDDSSGLERFGPMTYGTSQTPQVWLDYQVFEWQGELVYNWDALDDAFEPGILDEMFEAHRELLESLALDPDMWQREGVVTLPSQQAARRAQMNATVAEEYECLLHAPFIDWALREPDRIAVRNAAVVLTYGDLLARAHYLARELIRRGVEPNQLVAVVMSKGWEQIVAVMGILISGAAYLPVDPSWPSLRRAQVLQQGDVTLAVTQATAKVELPSGIGRIEIAAAIGSTIQWVTAPDARQKRTDLAYVIFTSGSTGTPKGVMIDHRGAVNTVLHVNRLYGVTAADKVLAVSDLSFDLSVYDIFGVLGGGGLIVIPERAAARDPGHWSELIAQTGVTVWNSAPQLMSLLVDWLESTAGQGLATLRLAMLSGDWIPVRLPQRIRALARDAQVVSLGGATEGSIWSIHYPVDEVDPQWDSIPYGRPLPNQQMHVLGAGLRPCPERVIGDIYIGGAGVALGYWKNAEKTARHFVEHPVSGERLYFTGDIGRYFRDGNIEFLGREDSQVKLRGYRVELGEITANIESFPGVSQAAVRLDRDGNRGSLVAYVVADARAQESALFETVDADTPDAAAVDRLIADSAAADLRNADPAILGRFADCWQTLEAACVRSMFDTLSDLGVLEGQDFEMALARLERDRKVKPEYARLVRRWLSVLLEQQYILAQGNGYRPSATTVAASASLESRLSALHAAHVNDPSIHEFVESVAGFLRNHARLLSGALTPLELLFPQGSWRFADVWYHNNPAVNHHNNVMATTMRALVESVPVDRPLRILELGAGTGGSTASILPVLPAARTQYFYTDVSSYFFQTALQRFAAHPFIEYSLFDINQDPTRQGYELHSYDAIVAANVAHNAANLDVFMARVRSLLKPNGYLVLLEASRNTTWQWVTAGYLEAAGDYTDERAALAAPALSAAQWRKVLLRNDFGAVQEFPSAAGIAATALSVAMPQNVIVARGPHRVRRFTQAPLLGFLRERLPEHMVPQRFVLLDQMPLSANGKVDLESLPQPGSSVADAAKRRLVPPRSEVEARLLGIWQDVLGHKQLSVTDNFFEAGGDSLLLVEVMRRVNASEGRALTTAELFGYPTVQALAGYITAQAAETQPQPAAASKSTPTSSVSSRDIAIVGMAGRFPDAPSIGQLWENIAAGACAVRHFSESELLEAGVSGTELANPGYVRAGVVLAGLDQFDADYFSVNPRDAQVMDPQQRFLLECAVEALDHAGYPSERYAGRIGVFAGKGTIRYLLEHVLQDRESEPTIGMQQILNLNDKDHVAPMISYKLNLTGPSLNVHTACSTSLVAVHSACQSLMVGECEVALAGGVSFVNTLERTGYVYEEGHITSPDGYCRAFAHDSNGCVFGNGVGLVVLKPLAAAIRDRDTIHAVIKGSAINNDGSAKVGYTAPSLLGQAQVIAAAQSAAGVGPDTIQYVEAHGTGTALGDPIEFGALRKAFGPRGTDGPHCAIGSLKSNLGHLDAAAGVAGLIKVVQSLQAKEIPATLHAEQPNPNIDFDSSPFYLNTQRRPWVAGGVARRGAVSSFGVGGTNAHVIVEEAPQIPPSATRAEASCQLFPLSGRTPEAANAVGRQLLEHLALHLHLPLADVAFTLQVGRNAHRYRRFALAANAEELSRAWQAESSRSPVALNGPAPANVFLFPGQGSQRRGTCGKLYQSSATFAAAFDECANIVGRYTERDIRELLFGAGSEAATIDIDQTAITQPLLFSLEYALARFWISLGVHPAAMFGHSLGEYVAACTADVISLEEALSLMVVRGQLLQGLSPGSMLAISASEEQLQPYLRQAECSLAAVNSQLQCVASGTHGAIESLASALAAAEIPSQILRTSHAFHSAMVDEIVGPYEECVAQVKLSPPRIPFVSGVTGTWITDQEATSPAYWARHLRQPVRFAAGMKALCELNNFILLEVGPGHTLSALAKSMGVPADRVVETFRADAGAEIEDWQLLRAVGRLWQQGVDIDWRALPRSGALRRVPLPSYPFERRRFWIDRPTSSDSTPTREALPASAVTRIEHPSSPVASLQASLAVGSRLTSDRGKQPRPLMSSAHVGPGNQIEERLVQIWESHLGIEGIGVADNFFELGGDSLLATRVYGRIKKEFDVDLPIRKLFELATVRYIYLFIALSRGDDSIDELSRQEVEEMLAIMEDPA
jgi:pyochelin synthetase